MTAYLCTSHGDTLTTYNAVLQIQQTVDKQGVLLLLRGLIILIYGDTAYSIVISSTADLDLLDAFLHEYYLVILWETLWQLCIPAEMSAFG